MGLAAQGRELLGKLDLAALGLLELLGGLGDFRLEGLHVGAGLRDDGLGLGALALHTLQLAAAGGELLAGGIGGRPGRLGPSLAGGQRLGELETCGLGVAQGFLGHAVGLLGGIHRGHGGGQLGAQRFQAAMARQAPAPSSMTAPPTLTLPEGHTTDPSAVTKRRPSPSGAVGRQGHIQRRAHDHHRPEAPPRLQRRRTGRQARR